MRRFRSHTRALVVCFAALLARALPGQAQQVTDTTFRVPVEDPAYPAGAGPLALIDQAHFNDIDADRYGAAADMLRRDGYVVEVLNGPITAERLRPARLLVSFLYGSSARRGIRLRREADPTHTDPSAFTAGEVAALLDWIAGGGALLLAIDHEPAPLAALGLTKALGLEFLDGIAYIDRSARLTFRREDGTLAEHPLTHGIEQIGTFGGSAFELERDGQPLLVFGPDVRAWVAADSSEISVAGRLQGAVLEHGAGRVAVFGEAGMFTAQLSGPNRNPMGMNAEIAKENPRLLRSVVHWLTGVQRAERSLPIGPAVASDSRVVWLSGNGIRLRSVSPDDEDFSDLEPLKQVIGGSRVIMLGEGSHGAGTAFLARTRLIKFLHREMGFDVLAFEGGLYDLDWVWRAVGGGAEPITAFRRGLYGTWSRSEQVQPLIEYVAAAARSGHPLEVAGFDSQVNTAANDSLLPELEGFLRAEGIDPAPIAAGSLVGGVIREVLRGGYWPWVELRAAPPSAAQRSRIAATLEELRETIAAKASSVSADRAAFWHQVLESLDAQMAAVWTSVDEDPSAAEPNWERYGNLRDAQMARNLVWLADERFRGRKLVVWAATGHIARNLSSLESVDPALTRYYRQVVTMGNEAWKRLAEDVYVLGVTAYGGRSGVATSNEPPQPIVSDQHETVELEELLHAAGLENAIIDFRRPAAGGEWLRTPIYARPLGHKTAKADWTQVLDGVLFIREMRPSTRANP